MRKIELTVREALRKVRLAGKWKKKKIVPEISKKQCEVSLETCRCCNSTLKYILDSIDLFRKAAKKENLVAKLKDMRKIEVLEQNVNIECMENLESGIRYRKNNSIWNYD